MNSPNRPQPMVVTCVTCSRRLKISNPELAGTIASCPACGSMVEIPEWPAAGTRGDGSRAANAELPAANAELPAVNPGPASPIGEDQVRVGSPAVDSAALTASSVQSGDENIRVPDNAPRGFTGGVGPADLATGGPNPPVPPGASQVGAGEASRSGVKEASSPGGAEDASTGLGGPAFESQSNQKARRLALLIASAAGTLILLGSLVAYWATRPDPIAATEGSETMRAPIGQSRVTENPSPDDASGGSEADDGPFADVDAAKDTSNVDASEDSSDRDASNNSPEVTNPDNDSDPQRTDPATDLPTGASPTGTDMQVASPVGGSSEIADATAGTSQPNLLESIDPLAPEPGAEAMATTGTDDGPKTDNPDDLLKGLEDFNVFVIGESPAAETNLEAPAGLEAMKLRGAAQPNGPLVPTERPEIEPRRDLAIELAAQPKDGRPVGHWCLLISQITGVPIELNLIQMDVAGIDAKRPLQPKTSLLAAGKWLDTLLEGTSLRVRQEPTQLVIEPEEEVLLQAIEKITECGDLPNATAALQKFLGFEDPNGRLFQDDTPIEMKLLAAIAAESFRRMRGLAGKMDDPALRRWALPLSDPGIEWQPLELTGQKVAAMNIPPAIPISLADFLRRTSKATGLTAIANWDDLPAEFMPSELLLPDRLPVEKTIVQRTLEPFKLVALKMDSSYFWVSSRPTYDRLAVLVWTQPLGQKRAELERQVSGAVAALPAANLPPSSIRYAYDSVSDRALILAPRFVARQLK